MLPVRLANSSPLPYHPSIRLDIQFTLLGSWTWRSPAMVNKHNHHCSWTCSQKIKLYRDAVIVNNTILRYALSVSKFAEKRSHRMYVVSLVACRLVKIFNDTIIRKWIEAALSTTFLWGRTQPSSSVRATVEEFYYHQTVEFMSAVEWFTTWWYHEMLLLLTPNECRFRDINWIIPLKCQMKSTF